MFNVELYLRSNDKKLPLNDWFDLDFQEGIIAANSQIDIGVTFSPIEVADLDAELVCCTKERPLKGTPFNQALLPRDKKSFPRSNARSLSRPKALILF